MLSQQPMDALQKNPAQPEPECSIQDVKDQEVPTDADAEQEEQQNDNQGSKTPVVDRLRRELEMLGVSSKGTREELEKRLKKKKKKQQQHQQQQQAAAQQKECQISVYLVVDFEATCERDSSFGYASEIIEFPCIAVSKETLEEIGVFHKYVRPTLNPKLSDFCVELTGITQEMVDRSDIFEVVYEEFLEWVRANGWQDCSVIVCDGVWDVRDFLSKELHYIRRKREAWMNEFVDVRHEFHARFNKKEGLRGMIESLGLNWIGREHCGIDDARNVVAILKRFAADGIEPRKVPKATGGDWKNVRK